ncbi:Ger(x)C family spore germination C-terminal domain-containing protein [Neobacillus drentensis]
MVNNINIIQNTTNLDMSDPAVVKMLEQQVEKQSENRVIMALDKVQKEMNVDIFGFSAAFHRAYLKYEKKKMG